MWLSWVVRVILRSWKTDVGRNFSSRQELRSQPAKTEHSRRAQKLLSYLPANRKNKPRLMRGAIFPTKAISSNLARGIITRQCVAGEEDLDWAGVRMETSHGTTTC